LPFAEAHFESIRLGLASGAKWALFLDADVLLGENALAAIVSEAESGPDPFFMLNFRVLDRMFAGPAYAGVHLYRVDKLHLALPHFERVRESSRPESTLCFLVARNGPPTINSVYLAGLHGYEQYLADLYRTSYVRAVKFENNLDYFIRRYRFAGSQSGRPENAEEAVILAGLLDGLVAGWTDGSAPLDARFYRAKFEQAMSGLGLNEIDPMGTMKRRVDQQIAAFEPDALYLEYEHRICQPAGVVTPAPDSGMKRRIKPWFRRKLLAIGVRTKRLIKQNL
jgi:hypothetical protein